MKPEIKEFFTSTKKMKLFGIWLFFIVLLCILWIVSGNPNDVTVAVSTFVCGLSTIAFWSYRLKFKTRIKRWKVNPRKKFVLIGSIGALWVEFIFWFFEKIFGAEGVAASPNLFLDFAVTMPWYIIMLFLIWKVLNKYPYSLKEITLLGGIYELGADGFVGAFLGGNLTFVGFLLAIGIIPLFVVVYSFMILPPTYLMKEEINPSCEFSKKRYFYALLPLLGLVPYIVIGLVVMGG